MSIRKLLNEPSSYAGYGLLALGLPQVIKGVSQIVDFDEGAQVAETTGAAFTSLSQGDFAGAFAITIFGIISIFKSEKAKD